MPTDLSDGKTVKASKPAIYLLERAKRRWLRNAATMQVLNLRREEVQTITDQELAAIPEGAALDLSDGKTVKGTGAAVYVMEGGKRRHVPDRQTLEHLGVKRDEVQELVDALLARIPQGPGMPPWRPTHRAEVLAYLRTLPELPAEPASEPKVVATPSPDEVDLEGIIYKQQQHVVELTKQFEEFGVLEPALHNLYPGALTQGRSLLGNQLAPIGLARAPGTITVTSLVPSTTAKQSRTLERPDLATVQQAITDLLRELDPVDSTGGKTEYAVITRTVRHGLLTADLKVNAGKLSANADVSYETQKQKSTVLWRLNQAYFTVSFAPSGSPAYFFDDTVTVDDLQQYAGPGNPPCYISSVTYGRMLLVLVTANASSETLKVALKVKYGSVIDGNLKSEYDELLSQSEVRIFSIGSTGKLDLGVLQNPLAELNNYLANGIEFSKDSPGAPILFRTNYLGSLAPAQVSETISYREIARVWANDVHDDTIRVWDGEGGGSKSTNIPVAQGDTVTITADGTIWSGLAFFGENGPEGFEYPKHQPPAGAPLSKAPAFSLLAGWDNGEWFLVGRGKTFERQEPGTKTLWFTVNDNKPYNGDKKKQFRVTVHVRRKQHPELHGVGSTAG